MDDLHDDVIVDAEHRDFEDINLFYDEVVKDDYDLLLVDSILKEVLGS